MNFFEFIGDESTGWEGWMNWRFHSNGFNGVGEIRQGMSLQQKGNTFYHEMYLFICINDCFSHF